MNKIITASNLSDFTKLVHGFTTRELGNDYDLIAQELKILPSQVYAIKQIHSNEVICFDKNMELSDFPAADAIITARKDVVIGVKTADCLPIIAYDPKKDVVAAIHAGYKGMMTGIIKNTVNLMVDHLGCGVEDMLFAIGPCISVDHYEVGHDVVESFQQSLGKQVVFQAYQAARPHLNLRETAINVLDGLGMHPDNLANLDMCTFERSDLFYSHRREPRKERQFSFIGMVS